MNDKQFIKNFGNLVENTFDLSSLEGVLNDINMKSLITLKEKLISYNNDEKTSERLSNIYKVK